MPPQIAELVLTSGDDILRSHRRDVAVVFCDLRGFTAFSEVAEPEEQITMLAEYHTTLGTLINDFEGTLIHIVGDGVMVVFNDPIPCPDLPAGCSHGCRDAGRASARSWNVADRTAYDIGFGIGIAEGYATLGLIGSEDRSQYTAIGTVTNLASRLCQEAQDRQIFIESKVRFALQNRALAVDLGEVPLRGFLRPVHVFNVLEMADGNSAG